MFDGGEFAEAALAASTVSVCSIQSTMAWTSSDCY